MYQICIVCAAPLNTQCYWLPLFYTKPLLWVTTFLCINNWLHCLLKWLY